MASDATWIAAHRASRPLTEIGGWLAIVAGLGALVPMEESMLTALGIAGRDVWSDSPSPEPGSGSERPATRHWNPKTTDPLPPSSRQTRLRPADYPQKSAFVYSESGENPRPRSPAASQARLNSSVQTSAPSTSVQMKAAASGTRASAISNLATESNLGASGMLRSRDGSPLTGSISSSTSDAATSITDAHSPQRR
ncbi:hypothetical protein P9209_23820 [Prescottella defluvii]|nr:hypothetical protein P9209_23820 [Prescottella defluvii]